MPYFFAVDIGNTLAKFAVYQNNKLLFFNESTAELCAENFKLLLNTYSFTSGIISNVSHSNLPIKQMCQDALVPLIELTHKTPLPITLKYKSVETLGMDRIALAVAASKLFPKQNNLVIGCGTCITYDFINADSEYLGGAISPGISMRFKSLHHFTENLPLVSVGDKDIPLLGQNTEESLQSGVINGVIAEIEAIILRYTKLNNELNCLLTGGDSAYLVKHLKNITFARQNLVLEGLHYILQYNQKN